MGSSFSGKRLLKNDGEGNQQVNNNYKNVPIKDRHCKSSKRLQSEVFSGRHYRKPVNCLQIHLDIFKSHPFYRTESSREVGLLLFSVYLCISAAIEKIMCQVFRKKRGRGVGVPCIGVWRKKRQQVATPEFKGTRRGLNDAFYRAGKYQWRRENKDVVREESLCLFVASSSNDFDFLILSIFYNIP